ncbi:MAG TPA: pirin family protein [Chitinophagaceae bacterium]|jgi:hypothetical protein|nr:pirin family protein [Chitinophagaceae bacterium]
MNTIRFDAGNRGVKDAGWLRSNFFFSFSSFQDPTRSAFGSIQAFNDDYLAPGKGFGIHPHINMEIISIMLKGSMTHKDSMGYDAVVSEDWVQIMSAGSGLYHEEHAAGEEEVNFLQIWIEPKQQNIRPRYQSRYFPKEKRRNQLTTVIWNEEGAGHCWINQNARLSLGLFDAGQQVLYTFHAENKCLFLFCISGTLEVAGETLNARDGLGIWNTNTLSISCSTEAEFLLIEAPVNQK